MLVLYSIFTSIILLVLAEVERSTGSWEIGYLSLNCRI